MTHPESRSGVVHPLRLPSLQSPAVANLLTNHTDLVVELADGLGSPIHLVLPEVFEENVERLRTTFARTGAEVGIFFAKKANKADCFVRSAAALGIGVDVASSAELMGALQGGVPGDRIGISGPEKDDLLLDQAVAHGCLLALDSLDSLDSLAELRRVAALAQRHERIVRVLLRSRVTGQPNSRFGMDTAERRRAVNECTALRDHVDLCGFSFHLNGYSAEERAVAANEMIQHCLDARAGGAMSVDTVNIGGGLPMRYVEPEAWADFLAHNGPEQYHPAKTDRGFYFYPYGGPTTADAAETLMNHQVDEGTSLADKVIRHGIRLMVEPGRSLLDQAGISIFRVRQIDDRRDQRGYAIVTVTGR